MSWGTRRRNTIIIIFFLLVAVPVVIIGYVWWFEEPTCFDGKLNGDERGVDCGGTCALVCKNTVLDPITLWSRYFTVAEGIYNVVAYVENPNPDAGIEEIGYTFKLYDKDNILINERTGVAKIPPKTIFPITENGLLTNQLLPQRVSFTFDQDFVWNKSVPQKSLIQVKDERLSNVNVEPRLTVELENISIRTIDDIDVVAILYDKEENAIRSSTTFLESLRKGERKEVTFTWPGPFNTSVTTIEVIPLYEIDN